MSNNKEILFESMGVGVITSCITALIFIHMNIYHAGFLCLLVASIATLLYVISYPSDSLSEMVIAFFISLLASSQYAIILNL
jgi:hypothetical protein